MVATAEKAAHKPGARVIVHPPTHGATIGTTYVNRDRREGTIVSGQVKTHDDGGNRYPRPFPAIYAVYVVELDGDRQQLQIREPSRAEDWFFIVEAKQTFRLMTARAQPAIQCLVCQLISFHPEDIENLYCGNCHQFHLDRALAV